MVEFYLEFEVFDELGNRNGFDGSYFVFVEILHDKNKY